MATDNYLWLTDTHFNFVSRPKLVEFFLYLKSKSPAGIFLTGDISTGPHIVHHLQWMSKIVDVPIYFVLGNHDYYRSSFLETEKAINTLCQRNDNLFYLTNSIPISLNEHVAIIGDDGWYDAGWRDPFTSLVFIWDFFFIKDFRALFHTYERMELVRQRARKAANHISYDLRKAFKDHSTVYLLTHFPPWPESIDKWGGLVEKFWMPYNSCKVMSDAIQATMEGLPDKNLIVLAGHTHRARVEQITHNIELRVGTAQHNVCKIEDTIFIEQKR